MGVKLFWTAFPIHPQMMQKKKKVGAPKGGTPFSVDSYSC